MTAIVIVAFAAHVIAWIALPSGKRVASAAVPAVTTAGINVSHA